MKVFLETARLILRQFTEDDARLLFELDNDPEVTRYVGPRRLFEVEAYRADIRDRFLPYYARYEGLGFWAAVEKASGEFLGWFCLRPGLDYRFAKEAGFQEGEVELGYRLRRSAWGKGYATEGSRAVVRNALAGPAPVRVVASALVPNRASTRVMEKLGMGRLREFALPGFDVPGVVYALPAGGAMQ
jgi:RimJ/RimL family protein N-acetyltransferase